jgi:hypothetical protein
MYTRHPIGKTHRETQCAAQIVKKGKNCYYFMISFKCNPENATFFSSVFHFEIFAHFSIFSQHFPTFSIIVFDQIVQFCIRQKNTPPTVCTKVVQKKRTNFSRLPRLAC